MADPQPIHLSNPNQGGRGQGRGPPRGVHPPPGGRGGRGPGMPYQGAPQQFYPNVPVGPGTMAPPQYVAPPYVPYPAPGAPHVSTPMGAADAPGPVPAHAEAPPQRPKKKALCFTDASGESVDLKKDKKPAQVAQPPAEPAPAPKHVPAQQAPPAAAVTAPPAPEAPRTAAQAAAAPAAERSSEAARSRALKFGDAPDGPKAAPAAPAVHAPVAAAPVAAAPAGPAPVAVRAWGAGGVPESVRAAPPPAPPAPPAGAHPRPPMDAAAAAAQASPPPAERPGDAERGRGGRGAGRGGRGEPRAGGGRGRGRGAAPQEPEQQQATSRPSSTSSSVQGSGAAAAAAGAGGLSWAERTRRKEQAAQEQQAAEAAAAAQQAAQAREAEERRVAAEAEARRQAEAAAAAAAAAAEEEARVRAEREAAEAAARERAAAEEARLREERERAEAAERARLQEEAAAKARENEAAEEAARAVEAKEREMAAKQEEERQLMERLKALQQEKLQIGDEVRAAGKGPKKYSKSELMVLRHEGPTDQLPAALLSPDVPPTHPIHAMKRDAQGGGGGARGGGRGGDRRGGPRDAQWERGGSDRSMGRRGRGPMGDRGPRGFRDDRGGGGFGRTTPPPGLGPDRWGSEAANMPALHKTGNRYVIGQVSGDDPEEEKRQKTFKSLLNKLTPDNFEKLLDKILNVEMPQKVTLVGLVDQIFDKALTETTFSDLYAQLCERAFGSGRLPQWEDEEGKTDFRRVLLNKCQDEFMKGAKAMFDHEHMEHRPKDGKDDKDDKAADEDKGDDEGKTDAEKSAKELELEKRRKELEIEQANLKARRRMFGNIQFIGHLYKRKMLIDKIMHECVRQLLRNPTNPEPEDVEALCKLLSTIGSDFDTKERAQAVDVYFNRMKQMREVEALDSRIKFMLQDVIEMRARGWQMRRAVEGPKKIADIHRAAAMEQRTPRGGPRGFDSRGPPMRGGGPSPRGFDSRGPPPSRNPDWMDRSAPRPLSGFGGGGGGGGGDDYLGPSGGRRTGSSRGGPGPARPAPANGAGAPAARPRVASDKDAWASGHGGGDSGAPTPTSPSRGAAGGAMTGAALARKVKSMCDEWHGVRQDVAEANLEIESMTGAGAKGADIVVELIKDGYGATKRNFASLKTLLTGALEAKKLSAADVAAGFSSVLEVIGDDVCDNPYAPKQVGTLAGQLVAEGVLDAAKLAKDMLSAEAPEGEEDPPLLDSGGAVPLVAHMLLAIKESKDEDAAKAAWKSIGKSLLDFHPSFEREDGQAAIDRDVEEFGLAGIV